MTLKFCKHTEDKSLTILLVGSDHIIQPLSASILEANNTENLISELNLHRCEKVQHVIFSSESCAHVDYIAFCIDSRSPKDIKVIEEEFDYLSKTFLFSRMCLILGVFGGMTATDTNMIINVRTRYQLHQLNGKINDEDGRLQLSRRLLKLVSFACGLLTGYPIVENLKTVPASEDEPVEAYDLSTSVFSNDPESSQL